MRGGFRRLVHPATSYKDEEARLAETSEARVAASAAFAEQERAARRVLAGEAIDRGLDPEAVL